MFTIDDFDCMDEPSSIPDGFHFEEFSPSHPLPPLEHGYVIDCGGYDHDIDGPYRFVEFKTTTFHNIFFDRTPFNFCDFANMELHNCTFDRSTFNMCLFEGTTFNNCRFNGMPAHEDSSFWDCTFELCTLIVNHQLGQDFALPKGVTIV